jgi:hypothetical protein
METLQVLNFGAYGWIRCSFEETAITFIEFYTPLKNGTIGSTAEIGIINAR